MTEDIGHDKWRLSQREFLARFDDEKGGMRKRKKSRMPPRFLVLSNWVMKLFTKVR